MHYFILNHPHCTFIFLSSLSLSSLMSNDSTLYSDTSVVPTSIPEGVNHYNISSRSFSLTWSPPEAEGRNGIITRYFILISSNSMSRVFFTMQLNIVFPTQGFTVQPYRTYFIQVAAATEIGRGPYSEQVSINTPWDGKKVT